MIDAELLAILACPACKTPVQHREINDAPDGIREWLVCNKCGRQYPVREGIPIMLIEEARAGIPQPTA